MTASPPWVDPTIMELAMVSCSSNSVIKALFCWVGSITIPTSILPSHISLPFQAVGLFLQPEASFLPVALIKWLFKGEWRRECGMDFQHRRHSSSLRQGHLCQRALRNPWRRYNPGGLLWQGWLKLGWHFPCQAEWDWILRLVEDLRDSRLRFQNINVCSNTRWRLLPLPWCSKCDWLSLPGQVRYSGKFSH